MEQPQAYQNGRHPTPPTPGGVVVVSRPPPHKPTIFPDDPSPRGYAAIAYAIHRFHFGGIPLARIINLGLPLLAAIWGVGNLPGRWWVAGIWFLLYMAHVGVGMQLRRRDYVTFTPGTPPTPDASPLTPQDKLPIRATGLLGVEGKYRRFTLLPGFYRTFATGEHALLCQARPRRWLLLGEWLPDEIGMWYAFIPPDALDNLQWGRLSFGIHASDALALQVRLTLPPQGRRKRELSLSETIYIAFDEPAIGLTIYADLLHHLPTGSPLATQTQTMT